MVTLVGHSWGAWLVTLFAEKYPELVEKVILVGCAPLEDKYVSEIGDRRFANLSGEESAIYERLINNKATDEDMKRISLVFQKSDNYCLQDSELHKADKVDSEMHNTIWSEAAGLRTRGQILDSFRRIKCNLYLIQGATDPHPVNGITIPLQEIGIACETYVLDKCGHSPFMEKYAKNKFYEILHQILL